MEAQTTSAVTRWGTVPAWWLHHPAVDADKFAILAAMATYADREGVCNPSQATLAKWLKRSRPWVNRIVADLAKIRLADGTPLLAKLARNRPTSGRRDDTTVEGPARLSPFKAADALSTDEAMASADGERLIVPEGWHPSPAIWNRLAGECPDIDRQALLARYIAQGRAKGYRYA